MTLGMTAVMPLTATSWQMYAGVGSLGVALVVILVLAIPRQRGLTTEERVSQYAARAANTGGAGTPYTQPQAARPEETALATAKDAAAKMLKRNQSPRGEDRPDGSRAPAASGGRRSGCSSTRPSSSASRSSACSSVAATSSSA